MNSIKLNNFVFLKLVKNFMYEITEINSNITSGDETVRGGGRKV